MLCLNYILQDKDAGTHFFLKTWRMRHRNQSLVSNTNFPRPPLWVLWRHEDSELMDFWSNPTGQGDTPLACILHRVYSWTLRPYPFPKENRSWSKLTLSVWIFNTVSSAALPCSSTWTSSSSKICSKSFWRKHFSKISRFKSFVETYYETYRVLNFILGIWSISSKSAFMFL